MGIQIALISNIPKSFSLIGKVTILWLVLWFISAYLLITYKQWKHYLYIILLLLYQANVKILTPYGEISYLDVGQDDTILIREPLNGEVMLIDVANQINKDIAKSTIYPFLKAQGIKKIDKVVISHDDYDHNGGLRYLQDYIPIDEVITTKQKIQLKKIYFDVYQNKQAKDKNDQSLVLFTQINQLTYLFTGDISTHEELQILDRYNQLKIDILKVSHHGSNTSSHPNFIHQIQPQLSVISSGRNNRYKHPSESVVKTLKQNNSKIINTQKDGSFSVFFFLKWNIGVSANKEIIFFDS